MDLESRGTTGFQACLCSYLPVGSWAGHFPSLGLRRLKLVLSPGLRISQRITILPTGCLLDDVETGIVCSALGSGGATQHPALSSGRVGGVQWGNQPAPPLMSTERGSVKGLERHLNSSLDLSYLGRRLPEGVAVPPSGSPPQLSTHPRVANECSQAHPCSPLLPLESHPNSLEWLRRPASTYPQPAFLTHVPCHLNVELRDFQSRGSGARHPDSNPEVSLFPAIWP